MIISEVKGIKIKIKKLLIDRNKIPVINYEEADRKIVSRANSLTERPLVPGNRPLEDQKLLSREEQPFNHRQSLTQI